MIKILDFAKLIRFNEWLDKLWLLIISLVVLLMATGKNFYFEAVAQAAYLFFLLAFGFLLNSVFEKDIDLAVGKNRHLDLFTPGQIKLFILSFLLIVSLLPLFFNNGLAQLYNLMMIILAVFYSMPPLYFKNKPVLGILVPSFLQGPSTLLFLSVSDINTVYLGLIGAIVLAVNIYMQLIHQVRDFENDKKMNLKTFAVFFGSETTYFMIRLFIIIVVFLLLAIFFLFDDFFFSLFAVLIYLIFLIPSLASHFQLKKL
ncbi:hypothetical protein C4569_01845 [Candidatus Parcubacteria bacterium]|nr:MAG: hypothetical protein C4569_01845 [Candidatus Parcubacteria bacterium]